MSFLNLPWQWDTDGFERGPIEISIKRWRRGPITFYRYIMHFNQEDTFTSYWCYIFNDVGIGIHLPSFIMDWILKDE